MSANRFSLALALALAACSSQVDSDYPGELLARLQGTVTSEMQSPPPSASAMLFWTVDTGEGDYVVGEAVEVTGDFPSGFTLDLYLPPSDESLLELPDGNRAGMALIGVAGPDANVATADGVYGIGEHHALIYVETDLAPDSEFAQYLGFTLEAGYHLMEVVPASAGEVFDTLMPAAEDAEIDVRMVDDLEELDIPNLG